MNRRRFILSSILASAGIVLFRKSDSRKHQSSVMAIGGTFTITTFASELNEPYTTEPIRFDATEKEVQEAVYRAYDKIVEDSYLLLKKNVVR